MVGNIKLIEARLIRVSMRRRQSVKLEKGKAAEGLIRRNQLLGLGITCLGLLCA